MEETPGTSSKDPPVDNLENVFWEIPVLDCTIGVWNFNEVSRRKTVIYCYNRGV